MQVTHTNDHVTHAVIGGKQAIEFGISNNAEFFNILSSTLYNDQVLAVVREVLCNAWDAHIDAGITSPIKVTLEDNLLTIRDYGKGIHHDDIGPIYGTYGASTKKNDGKQTGGFGLGCKAPFAYTDHFEVISYHNGVMTVYSMSKSSADVNGKPSITTIMSAPTTETGISVSLALTDFNDIHEFEDKIKSIAFQGDIPVLLNDTMVGTLNFPKEIPYLITNQIHKGTRILVKYGNVIYPVQVSSTIASLTKEINEILNLIKYNSAAVCIIFQAPPHSIAVTPSRESLSMQEHTIETLVTLFTAFIEEHAANFVKRGIILNKIGYDNLAKAANISEFFNTDKGFIDGKPVPNYSDIIHLTSLDQYTYFCMKKGIITANDYLKENLINKVLFMINKGYIDRGLGNSYISYMRKQDKKFSSYKTSIYTAKAKSCEWFTHKIVKPIINKALQTDLINLNSLFVSDRYAEHNQVGYFYNNHPDRNLIPIKQVHIPNHLHALPYVSKRVILTHSKSFILSKSVLTFNDVWVRLDEGVLVYVVQRKKGKKEDAITFFKKLGMTILDNIPNELLAKERTKANKPLKVSAAKPKGYLQMANILDDNGRIDFTNHTTLPHITAPRFYVMASMSRRYGYTVDGFTTYNRKHIVKKYGEHGVVLFSRASEKGMIKNGIPSMAEYIGKDVFNHFMGNTRILQFWGNSPEMIERISNASYSENLALAFIIKDEYLSKYFNLTNTVTDEDREYIRILQYVLSNLNTTPFKVFLQHLTSYLNTLPLSYDAKNLIEKVVDNKNIDLLNIAMFKTRLEKIEDPIIKQKFYDTFLTILNL